MEEEIKEKGNNKKLILIALMALVIICICLCGVILLVINSLGNTSYRPDGRESTGSESGSSTGSGTGADIRSVGGPESEWALSFNVVSSNPTKYVIFSDGNVIELESKNSAYFNYGKKMNMGSSKEYVAIVESLVKNGFLGDYEDYTECEDVGDCYYISLTHEDDSNQVQFSEESGFLFEIVQKIQKNLSELAKDEYKTLDVAFSRTACYGTCPAYDLCFFGDYVVFNGQSDVNKTGFSSYQIDKSNFDEMIKAIEDIDFMNLEGYYHLEVTDNPSQRITYVKNADQMKTVTRYVAKGPEGYIELEDLIDKTAEIYSRDLVEE